MHALPKATQDLKKTCSMFQQDCPPHDRVSQADAGELTLTSIIVPSCI